MSTVLTFKYISGGSETTVSFSDLEVDTVNIITHQETVLKRLCNRQPVQYYINPEWKEITIDLINQIDTHDNVETLRDVTSIMAMLLYDLNGTLRQNIGVRINPNLSLYYYAGEEDAEKKIRLHLWQATSGKAVALLPLSGEVW